MNKRIALIIFALLLTPSLLSPVLAAGEIKATDTASRTLYAVIENASGQAWNGTAFATYADASWTTYAVSVPEQGTSQQYVGSMPAGITTAARYSVIIYERQGASPAVTDPVVGQGILDWTGTALASEGVNTNTLTTVNTTTGTINTTTTGTNTLATGIKAKTDLVATNAMDSPNEVTSQGQAGTIANHQMGRFRYTPATHVLQLYLDDGTTLFGSALTLTLDGSNNILQR